MDTDTLKKAFSYPFEDDEWLPKLGVFLLMTLGSVFIIPGLFASGYAFEIRRRIILKREAPSLPEWDNWEELLLNGAKRMLIGLIAMLPAIIISMIVFVGPMLLVPLAVALEDNGMYLTLLSMPLTWLGMALLMLLYLLGLAYMTLATDHMAATGEVSAVVNIKTLWCILRNNALGYFLSALLLLGLYMVITVINQVLVMSCVLCCLAYPFIFIAMPYMELVSAALFARAYVDGADKCTEQRHDDDKEDDTSIDATSFNAIPAGQEEPDVTREE